MRAPSQGAIWPRAIAVRTVAMTCRQSSAERNDDTSIPRHPAGSTAASAGGKSCPARGRNRCGLRSSSLDNAGALSGRATRSGMRRLGLRMPRGRPRGLPELPLAKRRAPRACEAQRDQDQAVEIPRFHFRKAGDSTKEQATRQRFPACASVPVTQLWEANAYCTFLRRSHQGHTSAIRIRSVRTILPSTISSPTATLRNKNSIKDSLI
jgi:hypothetical protein